MTFWSAVFGAYKSSWPISNYPLAEKISKVLKFWLIWLLIKHLWSDSGDSKKSLLVRLLDQFLSDRARYLIAKADWFYSGENEGFNYMAFPKSISVSYRQHTRGIFRSFHAFVSRLPFTLIVPKYKESIKILLSYWNLGSVYQFFSFMTSFIWTLEPWNQFEVY